MSNFDDKEDLKTELKSDLRESIKTDFFKGEDIHRRTETEPLQKNIDRFERESL